MPAFDIAAGADMIDALTAISMSAAAVIRRSGPESGVAHQGRRFAGHDGR
jgi:hypothetical protein